MLRTEIVGPPGSTVNSVDCQSPHCWPSTLSLLTVDLPPQDQQLTVLIVNRLTVDCQPSHHWLWWPPPRDFNFVIFSILIVWPNGHHSCFASRWSGFDPRKGWDSGHVLLNHSLTIPRCKNGTSECGENLKVCPPIVHTKCLKGTAIPPPPGSIKAITSVVDPSLQIFDFLIFNIKIVLKNHGGGSRISHRRGLTS